MSPRTFRDYYKTCAGLIEQFGRERLGADLRPEDFSAYRAKLDKRFGKVSLKNEINRVSIVFNFAYPVSNKKSHQERLIDKPVAFGSGFDRPSAKALRGVRNEAGEKLFTRDEVLRILDALAGNKVVTGRTDEDGKIIIDDDGQPETITLKTNPVMRTMVLLGMNCGFGNTDVAKLPKSAVDPKAGWIDFPRRNTEIKRRIPIWAETIDALKAAIAIRPAPTDPSGKGLCFLTGQGRPWVRVKLKEKTEKQEAAMRRRTSGTFLAGESPSLAPPGSTA